VALRNRVTPFGEIVAVAARGTLMGNRGVLHNADRQIVRDWQVRRWIACRLQFRGRHRAVMTPGAYTELFFLDEAAALADGHRPCAECRHADFLNFQAAWRSARGDRPPSAVAMDAVLHAERRAGAWSKRTHQAPIELLPDGTYVVLNGVANLVLGDEVFAWSADRYMLTRRRSASGEVTVLTPPSIVAVLRAGYRPGIHPSASLRSDTAADRKKNLDMSPDICSGMCYRAE
jgi:hypothetical protein